MKCECGCGQETNMYRGKPYRFVAGHHSKNKTPWNKGTIGLMAIPWNKGLKGIHLNPECEFKTGSTGKKCAAWKGGSQLSGERAHSKRKELGYEFLNQPNIGLDGHHINIDQITHIPKEINHFCYHNVRTGKNMGIINYLALMWLITSGEINNCNI